MPYKRRRKSLNLLQKLYIYEMMYKKNSITDIYRVKITKIDIENRNSCFFIYLRLRSARRVLK